MSKNRFCNKGSAVAIVLLLMLSLSIFAFPIVTAHTPAWNVPLYAYIHAAPNPIGVNQQTVLVFWFDKPPPSAAGSGGDRWTDIMIEVTKPDGSKENLGPFMSDSVGGAYALYTPSQTGTYSFSLTFDGQTASLYHPDTGIPGAQSDFINDTYYMANTASVSLVVQQDPIPTTTQYPLPTEYWTRPIEAQNTDWASIASNWLGAPFGYPYNKFQPAGTAPNSAHIMWSKVLQFDGVVGGPNVGIEGMTYYSGLAYECKLGAPIIMQGRVYFNIPLSNNPTGNGYACVDLQTGEQYWWVNQSFGSEPMSPPFGQLYDYESMNQHGVIPNGYIWRVESTSMTTSSWIAYDGLSGSKLFTLTNVPSGFDSVGYNGERLRYVLNAAGGWLALWNNTAAKGLLGSNGTDSAGFQWRPIGKTIDASDAYSWNVTLPPSLGAGAAVVDVIPDDIMLGRSSTFAGITSYGTPDPYTLWAISLKPESRGQLVWIQSYPAPANNQTRVLGKLDPTTRIFTMYDKENIQWTGYSVDTGDYVWGPTEPESAFNYYATTAGVMSSGTSQVAYGKLYSTGFSGTLYCYDMKTGALLWSQSTPSGFETPYGGYSSLIGAIADNKVYTYYIDHSPNAPPVKGVKIHCYDATTGDELWNLMSWGADRSMAIADGYLVYFNLYDGKLYSIGKGPSATTVTAPELVVAKGSPVLIKGTVTDQAMAAKELVEDGKYTMVPAISDADQSAWMQYLYMQKPKPTSATGVQVKLTAEDSNGNKQNIGSVTSDIDGGYAFAWTPTSEGLYKITATFEGTNSYYGSSASTYCIIGSSAANPAVTNTPTAAVHPQSEPQTEILLIAGIAAILIVIIAVIAILLKKRA